MMILYNVVILICDNCVVFCKVILSGIDRKIVGLMSQMGIQLSSLIQS